MKIDTYTKIVLSVIAVCLVWICVMNTIPSVRAEVDSNKTTNEGLPYVIIAGTVGNIPVDVKNIEHLGTVPVEVQNIIGIPVRVDGTVFTRSMDIR